MTYEKMMFISNALKSSLRVYHSCYLNETWYFSPLLWLRYINIEIAWKRCVVQCRHSLLFSEELLLRRMQNAEILSIFSQYNSHERLSRLRSLHPMKITTVRVRIKNQFPFTLMVRECRHIVRKSRHFDTWYISMSSVQVKKVQYPCRNIIRYSSSPLIIS